MNVHFIAIGGSIMHNLAISLRRSGHNVSGSDDEIFEPALTLLKRENLMPASIGWNPDNIHEGLDAVILGMHAKKDNPELTRAQELGLKIFSFPAFVGQQIQNKTRVVIGGSHGKTTITGMIMHVLRANNLNFDYLIGSRIEGFDLTVKITNDAPIVVIEGDEYLSSAIERIPKFHLYRPHIALLTGIAWDHINVFPTFENYVAQFAIFVDTIVAKGKLIYNLEDSLLRQIALNSDASIVKIPYSTPSYLVRENRTYILHDGKERKLEIFGKHNLQNLEGARNVCAQLGISDDDFYAAIQTFKGAAKRLEKVAEAGSTVIYKDFAHSPSKLTATTAALKEQYPKRKLVAVMELHTYSSLSKEFLSEYKGSMKEADVPVVFFNSHALNIKGLPPISADDVKGEFDQNNIQIFTTGPDLKEFLSNQDWQETNLLMMSSGNFDGLDLNLLASEITAASKLS
jgi:UDP-N-acetylmuramate: L-alanyl-gamma-D-glutamyl-meso-diaminopimelate ligase